MESTTARSQASDSVFETEPVAGRHSGSVNMFTSRQHSRAGRLAGWLALAIGCGGTEAGTLDGFDGPTPDGPEPVLVCDPTLANFGAVVPGDRATLEIVCLNPGDQPWVWGSAELTSTTSRDFRIVEASVPRGGRIAPASEGGQISVRVEYGPRSLGDDEGTVELWVWSQVGAAPEPNRAAVVQLIGSGGGPYASITPAQLNLDLVSLLEPGRRGVMLTNGFDEAFEILAARVETEGPIEVRVVTDFPVEVPAGGSTSITVEFAVLGEGPLAFRIYFDTTPSMGHGAWLSGRHQGLTLTPCTYALEPAEIDFGPQSLGEAVTADVVLRNGNDEASCFVREIELGPGTDAAFQRVDPSPARIFLEPSGELTIPIRYQPTTVGVHRGTLELDFAKPEITDVVWLVGEGVDDGP